MTTFVYNSLHCAEPLEVSMYLVERDCYSETSGHYTEPWYYECEAITVRGVDIYELISDDILENIQEYFETKVLKKELT